MGTSTIVYILGIAASLYATYLIACCLYDVPDRREKREPKRITLPRIAYLAACVMAIVPFLNVVYPCTFAVMAVFKGFGDWQVKSWLFESPGDGKEDEKKE